jgi:two-component system, sensor histidine kinase PdtaS
MINLIHIYDELNNKSKGYITIKEIDYWIDINGVSPIVKCLASTVIADYDLRYGAGKYPFASKYLSKMRELIKITNPGNDNMIDYYLSKSLLDFKNQKYLEASEALINYHKKRSIVDEEIIKGHSQELAVKYETGKKEEQIKSLNLKTEIQEQEQALSQMQRNWAFIIVGLLAIMLYLYYNRYRLKKRTSDALAIKNAEIEKQKEIIQFSLTEKETLLREIHHRVKNNLQIISSLLNIQSENIQDKNVLSSIQEGQSRVQAMSLIHQNLYQSDHLNNVDIQNYVMQLVVYLSEMFAGQSTNIAVNVDAPDINFDIDTAIPLGLIINELVSNAYKYAFEKHASGKINISLKAKNDNDYELEVRDDGKGLPSETDPERCSSLGLKLVKILSRQLRGTFSFKSDKGAVFLVQFKDLRAYQQSNS